MARETRQNTKTVDTARIAASLRQKSPLYLEGLEDSILGQGFLESSFPSGLQPEVPQRPSAGQVSTEDEDRVEKRPMVDDQAKKIEENQDEENKDEEIKDEEIKDEENKNQEKKN